MLVEYLSCLAISVHPHCFDGRRLVQFSRPLKTNGSCDLTELKGPCLRERWRLTCAVPTKHVHAALTIVSFLA